MSGIPSVSSSNDAALGHRELVPVGNWTLSTRTETVKSIIVAATALAIVACSAPVNKSTLPSTLSTVSQETVAITRPNGFCSGVFTGRRTVQTAAHCVDDIDTVIVTDYAGNQQECQSIATDDFADLAWCTLGESYTAPQWVSQAYPRLGEQVTVVEHLTRPWNRVDTRVASSSLSWGAVILDAQARRGWSGSPVFNSRGELVCTVTSYVVSKNKTGSGRASCSYPKDRDINQPSE